MARSAVERALSRALLERCAAENYKPQAGRDVYRSSNCLICRIFPDQRARWRPRAAMSSASRRLSSPISRRKCGSRFSGSNRCATFGGASWATNIFAPSNGSFPYTWILDPTPLPQHAVIPRLEIRDWLDAAQVQPKRARPVAEDQWILAVRLGQPRGRARLPICRMPNGSSVSWRRWRILSGSRRSCSGFTRAACSIILIGTPNR